MKISLIGRMQYASEVISTELFALVSVFHLLAGGLKKAPSLLAARLVRPQQLDAFVLITWLAWYEPKT